MKNLKKTFDNFEDLDRSRYEERLARFRSERVERARPHPFAKMENLYARSRAFYPRERFYHR